MTQGLIVSIQNFKNETTQELAEISKINGCVGIRTNEKIKIDLPVIGLKKIKNKKYYITTSVEALKNLDWPDYIAIDSREGNKDLDLLYTFCHTNNRKIVADVENIKDVFNLLRLCEHLKINYPEFIATTFSFLQTGRANQLLIKEIRSMTDIKVIAEGKYQEITDIIRAFDYGAHNVCIGDYIFDFSKKIKYITGAICC